MLRFQDHTQTHTHTHTVGKTPLEEWSARRRHVYQTIHNILNHVQAGLRHIKQKAIHALDHMATGVNILIKSVMHFKITVWKDAKWENAQSLGKT